MNIINWLNELNKEFPISKDKKYRHNFTFNKEMNMVELSIWYKEDKVQSMLLNEKDLNMKPSEAIKEIKETLNNLEKFKQNVKVNN